MPLSAIVEPKTAHFAGELLLDSGRILPGFDIEYEAYGRLNADRSNAILVCHALSGSAHAAGYRDATDTRPGWWDSAIGPGSMLDTDRYFVICSSVIGGSGRSTGPASIDSATGRSYGMRFPVVTVGDMVRAQRRLIDHLGIACLHAVVGGCLGGCQALEWGIRHGDKVRTVVAITVRPATSAYSIALWEVIRHAIRSDPAWQGGDYYGTAGPRTGLGLATVISLLQWMDSGLMDQKYGRGRTLNLPPQFGFAPEFLVEQLIAEVASATTSQIDPNSFLYLTKATDYFDLAEGHASLDAGVATARGTYLLVSYERDHRYPISETTRLAEALDRAGRPVKHAILTSAFSHGAYQFDLEALAPIVASALAD